MPVAHLQALFFVSGLSRMRNNSSRGAGKRERTKVVGNGVSSDVGPERLSTPSSDSSNINPGESQVDGVSATPRTQASLTTSREARPPLSRFRRFWQSLSRRSRVHSVVCLRCGSSNGEFNSRCSSCDAELPIASISPDTTSDPFATSRLAEVPLVGTQLAHYRVLREIGAGGMGRVFAAEDTKLRRVVALKVLPPPFAADPERLTRFRREAQAVAALNHPNIVTIHSVEEANGLHFLTMELVDGTTVDRLIPQGGVPLDTFFELAIAIVEALSAAHRRKILHRDLKPANIMRSSDGLVKVLDFGLAKVEQDSAVAEVIQVISDAVTPDKQSNPLLDTVPSAPALTTSGKVLGTIPYMSPEQLRGRRIDQRSDLFSLGVILFELATGKRPFRGQTAAEVISSILRDTPTPAKTQRRDLPMEISKLIEQLLAKDSASRPEDAHVVLTILAAVRRLTGPAVGSPINWRYRTPAVLLVMSMIGLFALIIIQFRARQNALVPPIPHASPLITWPSDESGSRISPNGKYISFISDKSGTDAIWLQRLDRRDPVCITAPRSDRIMSTVWSPDGKQIACMVRKRAEIFLEIIAIAGGTPTPITRVTQRSPDMVRWIGTNIYFTGSDSLWRFDSTTSSIERLLTKSALSIERGADIRADEQKVVFSSKHQGQIDLWTANLDGTDSVQITSDSASDFNPRWFDRHGSTIIYSSDRSVDFNVWRISVTDGSIAQLTSGAGVDFVDDVSEQARLVTFGRTFEAAHIHSFDLKTGHDVQLTADTLQDFWPSAADSNVIAFQRKNPHPQFGQDYNEAQIFLSVWDHGTIQEPHRVIENGFWPRLSPDGRWLAHLRTRGDRRSGQTSAGLPEVWIQDLRSRRSWRIAERFADYAMELYPLGWSMLNLVWTQDSQWLYLVTKSPSGTGEIQRFKTDNEIHDPDTIVAANTPSEWLLDPMPTDDHRRLDYILRKKDGESSIFQVHDYELQSKTDRVIWEQRMPARSYVRGAGWNAPGSLAILPWSRENDDNTANLEVLALDESGSTTSLGAAAHAFPETILLDGLAQTLYLTRVEAGVHNLFAFSLPDGASRRLTQNTLTGQTISGIETTTRGSLLYSSQARNNDLWMIRVDAEP